MLGKMLNIDDEDEVSTLIINYINETGETQSPFTIAVQSLSVLYNKIIEKRPELSPVYHSGELYWASGVDKRKKKEYPETGSWFELLGHNQRQYSKAELLDERTDIHTEIYGEMPAWFKDIQRSASPKLISTMRLRGPGKAEQVIEASKRYFKEKRRNRRIAIFPGLVSTIDEVADCLAEFASTEYDYVPDDMDDLEREIVKLQDLLENDPYQAGRIGAKDILSELEIELAQSEHSFRVHVQEYQKAKHLCELINARLLFKSFQFDDAELTIDLFSQDSGPIPLSALSSGEQHLLLLYFHLLFEVDPDTLVMIDEPELSLNVVWQRNFLKDLQRIIELRKFDVLIATHSPQIIHDKWDWMVPLGEKMDD